MGVQPLRENVCQYIKSMPLSRTQDDVRSGVAETTESEKFRAFVKGLGESVRDYKLSASKSIQSLKILRGSLAIVRERLAMVMLEHGKDLQKKAKEISKLSEDALRNAEKPAPVTTPEIEEEESEDEAAVKSPTSIPGEAKKEDEVVANPVSNAALEI